eukprot:m.179726 g.179726  ORF g.179726 m.179726 type:complete len:308 (-) comp53425_c0_seq20:1485-2408(-)
MDDFSTSSEQYQTHLYRARALVVCPASIRFNSDSEQHVVLAFIYALQLTLAALFALFTYSRFNSVAIFTRSVRTSTISNIMWLYFFLAICVHGLVACVRYVASVVQQRDSQNANQVDKSLFTLQTLTETAASLLLCYALFHQYMHRSSNTQPVCMSSLVFVDGIFASCHSLLTASLRFRGLQQRGHAGLLQCGARGPTSPAVGRIHFELISDLCPTLDSSVQVVCFLFAPVSWQLDIWPPRGKRLQFQFLLLIICLESRPWLHPLRVVEAFLSACRSGTGMAPPRCTTTCTLASAGLSLLWPVDSPA